MADEMEILIPDDDAAPPAREEKAPDAGIDALKAQIEQERNARLAAERRSAELASTVEAARHEVTDTNLSLVSSAIERAKQTQETLKFNYAAAMRANDFDAAAEYQAQMAENGAELLQLRQGLDAIRAQAAQPRQPVRQATAQIDPVEALASQLTPQSADWVRRHPEYARDQRLYQKMLGAHNLVVADGVEPDSPEYFRQIEETLKIRSEPQAQDRGDAMADTARTTGGRQAAAPPPLPARGSASNGVTHENSSRRTVRLTADQIEAAEASGLTPEEYAKNILLLRQQGRM